MATRAESKPTNYLAVGLIVTSLLVGSISGWMAGKFFFSGGSIAKVDDMVTVRRTIRAAAEAGIESGRKLLLEQLKAKGDVNGLLNTVQFGWLQAQPFGVLILDNSFFPGGIDADGDGNPQIDSDGVVRLVSTGGVGGERQVVEAFVVLRSATGSAETAAWRTSVR